MANSLLFLDGRAMRFGEITVVCCRTSCTPRCMGKREAAHYLTGAVLSLLLAVALEAPPDTCPLSPLACFFSVPIEFSQRQNEDQLDRMGGPLDA